MKINLKAIVAMLVISFGAMPLKAAEEVCLKKFGPGDLTVKVVEFGPSDITVKLTDRQDADLSVGFTNDPRKADIKVKKQGNAVSTIIYKEFGPADLTIKSVEFGPHDLTLSIRSEGKVQLLIYSEDGHLDKKEIVALLGPLLKRLKEKKE